MSAAVHDSPCATVGLLSYRCRLSHGFVMIGARDDADALREASRSTDHATSDRIERWDGGGYVLAARSAPRTASAGGA